MKFTNTKFFHRSLFLVMVLSLLTACGGGGGGSTPQSQGVLMGGAVQGVTLNLTGTVSTFAGSGSAGNADGIGTAASFDGPSGITSDGANLYVADAGSKDIRQVVIATGNTTTLAGGTYGNSDSTDGTGATASFGNPSGIASDGSNLYVADMTNHSIRKVVITTGETTTLAGSVAGNADSTDNTGATAKFYYPFGVTTDGTNLYVADQYNHSIRRVVIATGETTTLAGTGSPGNADSTDGTGSTALFSFPCGITTDGTYLYVADSNNNTIRQVVIATGETTTLAGSGAAGSADGTGATATFNYPSGITSDGTNLYVADSNNNTIRQVVIATSETTTLAGSGAAGSADGIGTAATFNSPSSITTDGSNLYVADTNNNTIRRIQ